MIVANVNNWATWSGEELLNGDIVLSISKVKDFEAKGGSDEAKGGSEMKPFMQRNRTEQLRFEVLRKKKVEPPPDLPYLSYTPLTSRG